MKAIKFIVFLILCAELFSCTKVKQTQNKLEGKWNVIEYKITNSQGLTYYYTTTGTLTFENFSGNNCNYSVDIIYDNQGVSNSKKESGTLEMHEDGEYFDLNRMNSNGSTTLLEDGRIILITSTDLKTAFGDEFGFHQFILDK